MSYSPDMGGSTVTFSGAQLTYCRIWTKIIPDAGGWSVFGLWMGMALIFGSLSSVRRYAGDAEQGGVHHRGPDTCVTQSSPCWNGIKPSQSSNTPFAIARPSKIRVRAIYHWNQNRVRAPVSRVCSPTTSNGICALGQNPLPCALG